MATAKLLRLSQAECSRHLVPERRGGITRDPNPNENEYGHQAQVSNFWLWRRVLDLDLIALLQTCQQQQLDEFTVVKQLTQKLGNWKQHRAPPTRMPPITAIKTKWAWASIISKGWRLTSQGREKTRATRWVTLLQLGQKNGFLESQDQREGGGIMTPIAILISVRAKWVRFSVRRGNQKFALKDCFQHVPFGPAALYRRPQHRLTMDNSFWKLKNGTLRKTFLQEIEHPVCALDDTGNILRFKSISHWLDSKLHLWSLKP